MFSGSALGAGILILLTLAAVTVFLVTNGVPGMFADPTEASLRETLSGLQGFLTIEGVGHWPQLEAADAFNAALLRFLRSLA